jgi:hypothetical protein
MSQRTMSPAELSAWFRRAADRLAFRIAEAEALTQQQAYETAVEYSGGRLSLAVLAEMDHPYARRHGSPRLNPAYINTQSGGFLAGWRKEPGERKGDVLTHTVHNVSEVAPYLEQLDPGTESRMVPRPLPEAVLASLEPLRSVRLQLAIQRAIEEA